MSTAPLPDAASLALARAQRIDQVCQRFEAAWKAAGTVGPRPSLEEHLADTAEWERSDLVQELIRVEVYYRRRAGDEPRPADYQARFRDLDPEWLARTVAAVAGPGAAPPAGTTPDALASSRPPSAPAPAADWPPVPGHEVLGVLGRGGMGVVYQARHVRLDRVVALKMIRAGDDAGPEERSRFRREAEAVARLQHPHIVQIHEVGEHAGRPYLALEYVAGGSLAAQLAGTPQPARAAAALVETLARAIEHAHQRGIVHRDLKPSNVLLTADGMPKISDFGLAKRLPGEPGVSTPGAHTQTGAIVGTPSYMAPEQAGGQRQGIGPTIDVYALGAILYECLTGRPPFKGETVLDTLEQVRSHEAVPPGRLQPKLPRDLETICLKCLQKEPAKRYDSALSLADELRRFLDGRTIQARPAGPLERAWRGCKRHPREVAILGLVVLLLVGGAGAVWWADRQRLQHERQQEREARQKDGIRQAVEEALRQLPAFYEQFLFDQARDALARAEENLRSTDLDDLRRRVQQAQADRDFAAALDAIRQENLLVGAGTLNTAEAPPRYRKEFGARALDLDRGDVAELARRVQESAIKGHLIAALDDWAATEPPGALRQRLREVTRLADPNPVREAMHSGDKRLLLRLAEELDLGRFHPTTLLVLGYELARAGGDSVPLWRRAQQRYPQDFFLNFKLGNTLRSRQGDQSEAALGYYRAAVASRPRSAPAHNNLGIALKAHGDLPGAIAAHRRAIDLDPKAALAHSNLGAALGAQGDLPGAVAACRQAIALDPTFAQARVNLGLALKMHGDLSGAIAAYRRAIDLDPKAALAHINLGAALHAQGDLPGAIAAYRRAIDLDPKFAPGHSNLGNALKAHGDLPGAIAAYRRAIDLDPKFALGHSNLGYALRDHGDLSGAIAACRQAIALDPKFAPAYIHLGNALFAQSDLSGAIAAYRQAIAIDPKHALAHHNLGHTLLEQGDFALALLSLRRGHELGSQQPGWSHPYALVVRQCEHLIELEPKLPAVLNGEAKPKDLDEYLGFAELCRRTKRYAAAARFYADLVAVSSRPAAGLPAVFRYNAGRAAALAAAGRGEDAAHLDDQQRARLRRQALGWLRSGLEAWEQSLATDEKQFRPEFQRTVPVWQLTPELAGVRDEAALAKLPEEERQAWQQFWKDVAALLSR